MNGDHLFSAFMGLLLGGAVLIVLFAVGYHIADEKITTDCKRYGYFYAHDVRYKCEEQSNEN